jgi:protein-tyrosine phosphatase
VIDLHSHILAGLDDGPATLAESVEMARDAVADGITVVGATPHVRDDYPTTAEAMERAVAELRDALAREGVALDVRTGGEVALGRLERLTPDELRRFGLGGNPRYLLVETPYAGWPLDFAEPMFRLDTQGVTPVVAHPERNGEVRAKPELLEPLVQAGALVQLTAASLDGRFGRTTAAVSRELIERGLAHLVASDAHVPTIREIGMSSARAAVGDETLADWLTRDVPRAIVDDTKLPPRPQRTHPRGMLARLRGR